VLASWRVGGLPPEGRKRSVLLCQCGEPDAEFKHAQDADGTKFGSGLIVFLGKLWTVGRLKLAAEVDMRLITDSELAGLINMRDAVEAVRIAFEQFAESGGAMLGRGRAVAEVQSRPVMLSALGAVLPAAGVMGAKVYSTVGGRFNFMVVLFSAQTGDTLAVVEGNQLTRLRTAAATAVAAERLAAPGSRVLAVFGAGVQARAHAEALLLARPFAEVLVSARSGAPEFADWIGTEFGVAARAVDAEVAARQAQVIVTATRATEAVFDGAWIQPGAFVAAVGSSKPHARELDDALLARADLIAVEWREAVLAEAGEFVRAAPGVIDPERVVELGRLLVSGADYQRQAHDIVVYKSVGVGLEDLALAHLAWQRAS